MSRIAYRVSHIAGRLGQLTRLLAARPLTARNMERPFTSQRLHWPFEDPAHFEGTDEARLAKFREVRDLIDQRIRTWLAEQGIVPAHPVVSSLA